MSEMLHIMNTAKIQPISSKRTFTILEYYRVLSDFDR